MSSPISFSSWSKRKKKAKVKLSKVHKMILCEVNACAMYQTENVYKTVETNSITTLSLFI